MPNPFRYPEEKRKLADAALEAERRKLPNSYMMSWSDDAVVAEAEKGNPEAVLERNSRTKRLLSRAGDVVGLAADKERALSDEMNRRVLAKLKKHLAE